MTMKKNLWTKSFGRWPWIRSLVCLSLLCVLKSKRRSLAQSLCKHHIHEQSNIQQWSINFSNVFPHCCSDKSEKRTFFFCFSRTQQLARTCAMTMIMIFFRQHFFGVFQHILSISRSRICDIVVAVAEHREGHFRWNFASTRKLAERGESWKLRKQMKNCCATSDRFKVSYSVTKHFSLQSQSRHSRCA